MTHSYPILSYESIIVLLKDHLPSPLIKFSTYSSYNILHQTPHDVVNLQLRECDRGGAPRPLSHLAKQSPAFSLSPFLAFCLTDAVMEESDKGPTGGAEGTAAVPISVSASSSSPAPATPNLTPNRPASCQLVDR